MPKKQIDHLQREPSCSKYGDTSTPPCKWNKGDSDCESEKTEFFSPQETLVVSSISYLL